MDLKVLNNPHSTREDVTQKDLFDEIKSMQDGQFVKVEYYKIPSIADKRNLVKGLVGKISELKVGDLTDENLYDLIKEDISNIHGKIQTGFYRRPANETEVQDAAGYVVFIDDNDEYKRVKIANILNLTNSNGVKLVRNVG